MRNLSLAELRRLYTCELITPRELIFSLREQALYENDFNVWITLFDESTLDAFIDNLAGENPESLPLYGVPFAIKDNIDLAGVPTTAACPDFEYIPSESAYVVQRLVNAGAIPLGKTNLDQFATGLVGTRSPYGQTKNAFNSAYASGGSSAGSAVATALGQVSFALGTDTAGSGRVPAAFNNLIGLKPSKGLLSTHGVVPACRSLDCVSIFALNADDAASLFDICSGYDERDPYARKNVWRNQQRYYSSTIHTHQTEISQNRSTNEAVKFVFAVPTKPDFQNNDECEAQFKTAISTLEKLGGSCEEVDFSPFSDAAKLLYEGPWVAERQAATTGVASESMLPVIRKIIKEGNPGNAIDTFTSFYALAELKQQCDRVVEHFDFVLIPTTPTQFTRSDIDKDPIKNNSILGTYTNFMNLLDYCASSVPVGRCRNGVPWGVSLFSSALKDIHVLSYAATLHRELGLNQAASEHACHYPNTTFVDTPSNSFVDLIVCGAHLKNQPLNWQLTDRHAKRLECTKSSATYQLWALPDRKRPAMVRKIQGGTSIEIEIWRMPEEHFGSFVKNIPAPLGIGKVETADGRWLPGFICDIPELNFNDKNSGLLNISAYGGWRAWLKNL